MPRLAVVARLGEITLPRALAIEPWLVTVLFAELAAIMLLVLRRQR